jgi:hypothetical protein
MFKINVLTTESDFEAYISDMYFPRLPVRLYFDVTEFPLMCMYRAYKLKRVIESYRQMSRKYLIDTTVYVSSPLMSKVLSGVLYVFSPEKPVHIVSI